MRTMFRRLFGPLVLVSMGVVAAYGAEPTIRMPAFVLKASNNSVMGPVTGISAGEIAFSMWDSTYSNAIPMALRVSSGSTFVESLESYVFFTGTNCTGTAYLPDPAATNYYRALARALGRTYGVATSTGNSNLILYRGSGAGSNPAFQSNWLNGACSNTVNAYINSYVLATPILDLTANFPAPYTAQGDGNIPLSMNGAGDVGIGTTAQTEKVHVIEDANANTLLVVENPNAGTSAAGVVRVKSNSATLNFQAHATARTVTRFGQTLGGWDEMLAVAGNGFILGTLGAKPLIFGTNSVNRMTITDTGNVGIGVVAPAYPLELANGAHVTVGGAWTNGSSRSFKEDVKDLDLEDASKALSSLEPVTFRYKNEKDELYVGFIAEDVPQLVAMNDRKSLSSMDIVAVLTKVVQNQSKTMEEQSRTIEELAARVKALEAERH